MKTRTIIYFSILLSLFTACRQSIQHQLTEQKPTFASFKETETFSECPQKITELLSLNSKGGLVRISKKDTIMGIDMGYYFLPDCWSSTKTGLQGPDSTTAKDYTLVSKAKLKIDYGPAELLGYQAIVDEYIKEEIVPELFKTKSRLKSITHSEAITHQFNKHFNTLFPCSAPPAHFYVTVLEHTDKKGNPGLSVLYFMIFESTYGNALHYYKSELSTKPENYEQDKKDYLYALANAEYFSEYLEKVHQIQWKNPQDVWYQYNNQLLGYLTRQYWNIPEYPIDGKYRPWRSNRFGEHKEYLEYINQSDTLYNPEANDTIYQEGWDEIGSTY